MGTAAILIECEQIINPPLTEGSTRSLMKTDMQFQNTSHSKGWADSRMDDM